MKSSKLYNNISDKLKAEIPTLKPGEIVVFQMLNGVPNPEPDEKERSKNPILYGKVQLQTNFRIFDPYKTDSAGKEVGGYVDVGCADGWNGETPTRFRMFIPGMGEYSAFQGKFSFTGGNIQEMELFEVLWLSNQREGNKYRDEAVEPLFKMLDLKADSAKSVSRVSTLRKALEIAKDITEEKAREVMAALMQPSYQDKDVLMAKIGELASSKPDLLIKTFESTDTSVKYAIKEALDSGAIDHDLATGQVKMGGLLLTTLASKTTDSFLDEMTAWINTSENGKGVLANIKKQGKKEAAKA